jgi:hypothetical protein
MTRYHDLVRVFQTHHASARQHDSESLEAIRSLVDGLTAALHWNGGGVAYQKIDPAVNERRLDDFVVSRDGTIRCVVDVTLVIPLRDDDPDPGKVVLTVMLSMRHDAGEWFVRAGTGDEAPCAGAGWVETLAAQIHQQMVNQAIAQAWFPLKQG